MESPRKPDGKLAISPTAEGAKKTSFAITGGGNPTHQLSITFLQVDTVTKGESAHTTETEVTI